MSRVDAFLELAVRQGGSDLHLVSGEPPRIRINGTLHRVRFRDLTNEDMQDLIDEFMPAEQRSRLEQNVSVDFAYAAASIGRFRCNVYRHVHGFGAAMRTIPDKVPTLEELGLPPVLRLSASQRKGLTLVTGPTGSGKSTTLAAIVDCINATRRGHIVTLEDPIEFIHPFKKSVVTQREIHIHAPSFATGLRDALREDPDVILVGELRDTEAIGLALTAAETGIQVLGTLHTSGAPRAIDRIVNVFPARRHEQVRSMLADSLTMIVSQRLLKSSDGSRRVAALEIMVNNHAAKAMIRAGQTYKLESVMQAGGRTGMQTFTSVLKDLVQQGIVTAEEAYENTVDRSVFENMPQSTAV